MTTKSITPFWFLIVLGMGEEEEETLEIFVSNERKVAKKNHVLVD
jgi:hypothetical protein